ncbi:MAG TPA: EamA family transporter RarD [Polyangiaceae bacterium]|nr:EamA family transporter RarD [Polyangiaceae bacterium]
MPDDRSTDEAVPGPRAAALAAPDAAGEGRGRGVAYALATYVSWGFLPLFFRLLRPLPPAYVVAHRVIWASLLFAALCALTGRLGGLRAAVGRPRTLAALALSAVLIAVNWLLYVYAVSSGRVLEASLGYFINPLLNVALGVAVLGERLERRSWLAIGLAAAGVLVLSVGRTGGVPWLSLGLALSFGLYGLVRKRLELDTLTASTLEALLLAPFGLAYALLVGAGAAPPPSHGVPLWALLLASGALTAVPLYWFASAARLLPLSQLGFFQYISPSLQFLLAVLAFGETFTARHAWGFGCIWAALALSSLVAYRRAPGGARPALSR